MKLVVALRRQHSLDFGRRNSRQHLGQLAGREERPFCAHSGAMAGVRFGLARAISVNAAWAWVRCVAKLAPTATRVMACADVRVDDETLRGLGHCLIGHLGIDRDLTHRAVDAENADLPARVE